MKQYTVEFAQGTVTGTYSQIEHIAEVFGTPIHYSASTDEFVLTEDMNINHLENAILKQVNDKHFESVWELAAVVEGALYQEWVERSVNEEEEE